jgi:hypothetical protein
MVNQFYGALSASSAGLPRCFRRLPVGGRASVAELDPLLALPEARKGLKNSIVTKETLH